MNMKKATLLSLALLTSLTLVGAGCVNTPVSNSNANKNTNTASTANVNINIDTSSWTTIADATYAFSYRAPIDWSINTRSSERPMLFITVETLSDQPNISMEELRAGALIGDGYGYTQETFKEERNLIATSSSVASQYTAFDYPVVQFKNGLRAKEVINGDEGVQLMKEYTLYHGDYRLRIRTEADDVVETTQMSDTLVTQIQEASALTADAPRALYERFATLEAIVESLDLSAFKAS